MDYPEPREPKANNYTEILQEIYDILRVGNHWQDMLDNDSPLHNYEGLNSKLEEILSSVQDYSSYDLVGWVRYSSSRRKHLPAWKALCAASMTQCTERNSQEFTNMLFSGMTNRIQD